MSFIRRGLTSHHGPGRQLTMATEAATPEAKSRCLPNLFVGPHSSQCRPIILPPPRSDHVQTIPASRPSQTKMPSDGNRVLVRSASNEVHCALFCSPRSDTYLYCISTNTASPPLLHLEVNATINYT